MGIYGQVAHNVPSGKKKKRRKERREGGRKRASLAFPHSSVFLTQVHSFTHKLIPVVF